MTFFEHLEELRKRLFWIVIAILIGTSITFGFALDVIAWLKVPLDPDVKLYYMNVMEPFMVKLKVAIFTGVIVALPVIFYQLLSFIAPALEANEKRIFYPMIVLFVSLFLLGGAVSYEVIMPFGVTWLVGQAGAEISPVLSVSQYVSFAILFIAAVGTVFETPIVILLLVKIGIVTPQQLRANWRIAYVVLMLVSAIATPDWNVIPMIMLSVIMVLLYEMSILLSKLLIKKKDEEVEE